MSAVIWPASSPAGETIYLLGECVAMQPETNQRAASWRVFEKTLSAVNVPGSVNDQGRSLDDARGLGGVAVTELKN